MMPSGMILPLRVLINDLSDTPTYSNERLSQVLVVAVGYVQQDLRISTYTTNSTLYTISPDPTATDTLDTTFVNFAAMKAACFIDQSALRTKASAAGVRAVLGPMSLQVTDNAIQGFVELMKNGACAAYQQMLMNYMTGNLNVISAILSPFAHNQYDPREGSDLDGDPFFTQ